MPEILPSILSADFARLAEAIAPLEAVGCKMLHVDVMDGHFVPNITLGPPVVKSLRKVTRALLDCHLMIENPDEYIPAFVDAGADLVSVHQEASRHLDRSLRLIRERGAQAGVVINPATPVSALEEVLDIVNFVLVMSVNPGFSGQKFLPNAIHKVRYLARLRRERGLQFHIEIDGGISPQNIGSVVEAGAEWMVAGSSVFQAEGPDRHSVKPADAFQELTRLAREATLVRV